MEKERISFVVLSAATVFMYVFRVIACYGFNDSLMEINCISFAPVGAMS